MLKVTIIIYFNDSQKAKSTAFYLSDILVMSFIHPIYPPKLHTGGCGLCV